jgi:hypothetical protein
MPCGCHPFQVSSTKSRPTSESLDRVDQHHHNESFVVPKQPTLPLENARSRAIHVLQYIAPRCTQRSLQLHVLGARRRSLCAHTPDGDIIRYAIHPMTFQDGVLTHATRRHHVEEYGHQEHCAHGELYVLPAALANACAAGCVYDVQRKLSADRRHRSTSSIRDLSSENISEFQALRNLDGDR